MRSRRLLGAWRDASLRTALKLDAIVTAANGAAYVAAAGALGDLFGLSPALLRAVGVFLLVFAVIVWRARAIVARLAIGAIVAVNALWGLAGIVAALTGWGSPETVGTIWMIAQALVVASFAELQLSGLRRESVRSAEAGVLSAA